MICSEAFISKPQEVEPLKCIDNRFAFEEACIVYREFVKFETGEADKTRILHLVRLYSIIAYLVNSLIHSVMERK